MFAQAVAAMADEIRAAGVRAATDPRDANPPCALVVPVSADPTAGGASVVVRVFLIAPNMGTDPALAALDGMAATVRAAGLTGGTWRVENLDLPGGGDPLPAYTFDQTVTVC